MQFLETPTPTSPSRASRGPLPLPPLRRLAAPAWAERVRSSSSPPRRGGEEGAPLRSNGVGEVAPDKDRASPLRTAQPTSPSHALRGPLPLPPLRRLAAPAWAERGRELGGR